MGVLLAGPASGQATVDALLYAPAADVRLGALLTDGSTEALQEASALYLGLLSGVGPAVSSEQAPVLRKHVAQLALVLPRGLRAAVVSGALRDDAVDVAFHAGAGEALLAWWRSQDPLPATPGNERLEEHLQRVAFAQARYPHPDRLSGLDDRGETYVQYGAPSRITTVTFDDPQLIDAVYQPGVVVTLSDFPDNEVWWYPHIDRTGYFMYYKKGPHYHLGEIYDLLPNTLRYSLGNTDRTALKAAMVLAVMRSVYQQLALLHPDFALRYQAIDDYTFRAQDALEDERTRFLEGQVRGSSTGTRGRTGLQANLDAAEAEATYNPFLLKPQEFAEHMIQRTRVEDEQAMYRRQESMPEQFTEVFDEVEILPLSVRTARFLDDDATRTEIYWSPTPGGLRPSESDLSPGLWTPDHFLIHLTVVQQTADYQDRQASRKPYLIADLPEAEDASIPAQTMVVHGDTGRYNLALQWDQHRVRAGEAEGVHVGPKVGVATHRADSLTALRADERILEMSDLKPIFVSDLAALDAAGASGEPYPHPQIWPDLPLGLYFEIYHLAYGDDDQTHYTIAYEIARSKQGGLLRFLGRGDEERTSVQNPYTGQSRTAREYIVLDMSEWEGEGALEVRVQVTDDVTGRQMERRLVFDLMK